MLPALVNKFEAIAIGVKDIRGVVAWIVVKTGTWCTIVRGTRIDGGGISGIYFSLAVCDEADMR